MYFLLLFLHGTSLSCLQLCKSYVAYFVNRATYKEVETEAVVSFMYMLSFIQVGKPVFSFLGLCRSIWQNKKCHIQILFRSLVNAIYFSIKGSCTWPYNSPSKFCCAELYHGTYRSLWVHFIQSFFFLAFKWDPRENKLCHVSWQVCSWTEHCLHFFKSKSAKGIHIYLHAIQCGTVEICNLLEV